MDTSNIANEPKKKKLNDFTLLFLGIGGVIAALVLLKYIMGALHVL